MLLDLCVRNGACVHCTMYSICQVFVHTCQAHKPDIYSTPIPFLYENSPYFVRSSRLMKRSSKWLGPSKIKIAIVIFSISEAPHCFLTLYNLICPQNCL